MTSFWLVCAFVAIPKIAVLELKGKLGVSTDEAEVFSELVQNEVRRRGNEVVGKSDLEAVLGYDRLQSALACDSNACFAEIGGALGATELLTGTIAQMGAYVVVTLKRIDPKRGGVLAQAVRTLTRGDDLNSRLVEVAGPLITELFGAHVAPEVAASARNDTAYATNTSTAWNLRITNDHPTRQESVEVIASGIVHRCLRPVAAGSPCTLRLTPGLVRIIREGKHSKEYVLGPERMTIAIDYVSYWWGSLTLGASHVLFYVMFPVGARMDNTAGDVLMASFGIVALLGTIGGIVGLVYAGFNWGDPKPAEPQALLRRALPEVAFSVGAVRSDVLLSWSF